MQNAKLFDPEPSVTEVHLEYLLYLIQCKNAYQQCCAATEIMLRCI